jgi:hypothetical protein
MKDILDLLHSQDFIGVSKNIDIAKGLNEYTTDFKEAYKKIKRVWQKKE